MTTITTIGGEINFALSVTIVEMVVVVAAVEAAMMMISKIEDRAMMIDQDDLIMIDMGAMIVKANDDSHLIKTLIAVKDRVMTMMIIMVVVDVVVADHLHGTEIDIITMTTMDPIIRTKTMMIFYFHSKLGL